MPYSLQTHDVKAVLKAVLDGKNYNREQFMYYHLYRNHFNVKDEVKNLSFVREGVYVDNLGNQWSELSTLKNYFHMPFWNWVGSVAGAKKPYSRKFVRPDYKTGLDGEFEMIIRHDGKRVDALTHEDYQETYNFGRTSDFTLHKRLDVDPHRNNDNYTYIKNMGRVHIIEKR